MLLQPITVPFSKSTLKPSVYTLRGAGEALTLNSLRGGCIYLAVNPYVWNAYLLLGMLLSKGYHSSSASAQREGV